MSIISGDEVDSDDSYDMLNSGNDSDDESFDIVPMPTPKAGDFVNTECGNGAESDDTYDVICKMKKIAGTNVDNDDDYGDGSCDKSIAQRKKKVRVGMRLLHDNSNDSDISDDDNNGVNGEYLHL